MSMQILQYEFLGPVSLSEWGPPMGELVYVVLSGNKDRFDMLYAGDCEHTDESSFFVQHEQFKCWIERAGSESALYLAVFPMKGYGTQRRQTVLHRILSSYKPPCNPVTPLESKPSYNVRRADAGDAGAGDSDGADAKDAAAGDSQDDAAGNDASSEPRGGSATITCPCCGSGMDLEKRAGSDAATAKSSLYRCSGCGMSETRID